MSEFRSELSPHQQEEYYLCCTKGENHYYRMTAELMERSYHPIKPAILEFLQQSGPGDSLQVNSTLIIHVRHEWN